MVLAFSTNARAPLLTADKDFGELVYRQKLVHHGVILLRIAGLPLDAKARLVATFIEKHAAELKGGFAVVTSQSIRIRSLV